MGEKIKSFLEKIFDKTFLKFLLVGVINTLFGTAIMFGFYNLLHLSYWVSSAANYFFGSILSYFLNKHFTFKNTERSAGVVIRFVVNICLCYLIAYGAARPLVRLALSGAGEKVRDNLAMLVGMGLFVMLNYFGQRFFAFAEREGGEKVPVWDRLKSFNASRPAIFAAAGLIGLFMLLLNLLTPYVADDFAYMESFKTQWWIESVWDIFPSMAVHARIMNGRLISHGLGQLFMLWPKAVFDLANAAVFTGLIYLLYSLVKPKKGENLLLLIAIFAALWYFMPVFGQVALWQIGSVNYLWALFFGLLYLRPFILRYRSGEERRTPIWRRALFCVLALPFGMYTEITSFICVFLGVVYLILGRAVKKLSLKTWLLIPIAAAIVGYILMMSMPAQMKAKSSGMYLALLLQNFKNATLMLKANGLWLLISWAVAIVAALFARVDAGRLTESVLYAAGAVAANYMLTAASYYPERCFCTTAMLLIAAVAVLVPGLVERGRAELVSCAGGVLAVVTALSLVTGVYDIWTTHTSYSAREMIIAEAKEAGEKAINLPLIYPATKYSAYWGLKDLDCESYDAWPNGYIGAYYGIKVLGK